jgi:hypothetical protein
MTTTEIANVLHARAAASGKYTARCPAHDDRRASLTIAEGRAGRTLVYCWAGCPTDAVMSAVGLTLRDLFDGDDGAGGSQLRQPRHQPSAADIEGELAVAEAERLAELGARGVFGTLLTSELNDIRERVSRRTGVELERLTPPLCEGGYGGRDRDPLWPAIFEAAWHSVCVSFYGGPLPSLREFQESNLRPPGLLFVLAEDLAAKMMRDEANAPQRSQRVAA